MIIIAHDDDCEFVKLGPAMNTPVGDVMTQRAGAPIYYQPVAVPCSCGGHKYRLNLGDRYDLRRWTALVEEVTE